MKLEPASTASRVRLAAHSGHYNQPSTPNPASWAFLFSLISTFHPSAIRLAGFDHAVHKVHAQQTVQGVGEV
jgi:hypothetical protein